MSASPMAVPLTVWEQVVQAYGSLEALGHAFNITKQSMHRRVHKGGPVPAEWCAQIERETGIPRWRLRSDLWSPEMFGRKSG